MSAGSTRRQRLWQAVMRYAMKRTGLRRYTNPEPTEEEWAALAAEYDSQRGYDRPRDERSREARQFPRPDQMVFLDFTKGKVTVTEPVISTTLDGSQQWRFTT